MHARTKTITLAALVLALLGAAAGGAAFRVEIEVGWLSRRLARGDRAARKDTAERLLELGPRGIAALEAAAFSSEIAEPESDGAKERAVMLTALWEHEASETHQEYDLLWSEKVLSDERLARYLVEARGVRRDAPIALNIRKKSSNPALVDAAATTMLTDPIEVAAEYCASYVAFKVDDVRVLPALRRAALESPFATVRSNAAWGLGNPTLQDEANVPVLLRMLGDRDEAPRVAAAMRLAETYGDRAGFTILVAALRPGASSVRQGWAAIGLGALGDRRVIAALANAHDAPGEGNPDWCREKTQAALARLMKSEVHPEHTRWAPWLVAHASELRDQLDPSTFEVAPIANAKSLR